MEKEKSYSIKQQYDVVVVGGGIAGVCSALASARTGAKTLLVQDRPVLGGNASSEIRMHICGASQHGKLPNRRESGIIEEILLENKYRNPEHSYALFDSLLWEKTILQENLTVLLNTYMSDVVKKNGQIHNIVAIQLTTEKRFDIEAKIFIDCTGDGTLSFKADASFMLGREDKARFNEAFAVSKADDTTMGNSIMFRALDVGHPVDYTRPSFAYDYTNSEWTKNIKWTEITSGYWWVEVGGTKLNCIHDSEDIKNELYKIIFGIWDYIKKTQGKRAENLVLDWVGAIPAKRESRRIIGDYVLNENDIINDTQFNDAVGYGGWHIDSHPPERFYTKTVNGLEPDEDITRWFNNVYQIPYRALYSKDIKNLMLGGRAISASHRAFASTRVMGTCAVLGQAVGTAAAMAVQYGILPHEIGGRISELQQRLLKDDCYIPNHKNEDNLDLVRNADISCSSELVDYECTNIKSGVTRTIDNAQNLWVASMENEPQWLKIAFNKEYRVNEVRLTFDSNLSIEIMPSLSDWVKQRQDKGIPKTLVSDYSIELILNGKVVQALNIKNNYLRLRVHNFKSIQCDTIRINVLKTAGSEQARIFEVRAY